MEAPELALRAGDRFRVDGAVYQALRVQPDPWDVECLYVWTDLEQPPMWVSVDDVEEIVL